MFVPLTPQLFQWENYDLILPAVSYANVGQLVVDIFVTDAMPRCVGHFYTPSVLPVVGFEPHSHIGEEITTNMKVFVSDEKKFVLIQQRSQVIYGQENKFLTCLIEFIKTHKFKRVIMLSSGTSQYFPRDDTNSITLHFLCTSAAKSFKTELEDRKWKEYNIGAFTDKDHEHMIPGGGISNLFFDMCEKQGIALVLTIMTCWEGDNILNAVDYCHLIYDYLFKIKEKYGGRTAIRTPASWTP